MAPSLDHILILLPYEALTALPTSLTDNFTISPGGAHSDGLTENKLIIFSDGSYIELVAFTPFALSSGGRSTHWWGNKKEGGFIDFAFITNSKVIGYRKNFEGVNSRLKSESGLQYSEPRAGARIRPDGERIEWFVTFPKIGGEGGLPQTGVLPFFCHDVTDRGLRVPLKEENVTHPCGALGVKSFNLFVDEKEVTGLRERYSEVFDAKDLGEGSFETPSLVGEGSSATIQVKGVKHGEELLKKELEKRGGLFFGDLVLFGKDKVGDNGSKKILHPGEGGDIRLGGISLN